ncbi:thioredoxin family protein [Comamonas flocculans]|uniref:Thioredoxin family protein n=1 Tax=Comamonas flocculans TaxID=2597701 RepID=A0A5B8RPS8_9BURK|nr:thioredoxin family protein [Comamonas flocculans]QEA11669.1 thioredoxin family protein [Comamonas flocculans]
MSYNPTHLAQAPTREAVDQLAGAALLEFGTPWCGHCARAQPLIEAALGAHPEVQHLKVEDGPGRKLGRSYGVKLWPTLIFLKDGAEVARLVRPQSQSAIGEALAALAPQSSSGASPGNKTSI